ncbi:MAG: creatininase family protein [Hyphomicrobiales bacterium]|jgi:creatinine amidohydrolase|nr:creatininase family protein [Hyphomicrobiales bacterium]
MPEVNWGRLKAADLRRLAEDNAILIIPIGATEQHGPHLPVMVDYRLALEVSVRAAQLIAEREPVVVAPVIPYGMSEHHVSLGGTLTLDFETMQAVINCLCDSAVRQGFRRIFILNGHGGNMAALETIVTELTIRFRLPIACGTYWQMAPADIAALMDRQTAVLHACEAETSMIMAVEIATVETAILSQCRGELIPGASAIAGVNPGTYRWRQIGTRSLNGVIGDATTASADKGEAMLNAVAARVAEALTEKALWNAPI